MVVAQNSTAAKQLIVANGGKFETVPPFSDYVTVESYNLTNQVVTVFNTIYTQSVQDVLIENNLAYVTAQDSIVLYNIDTYQRIAAVKDSGVNKMALYNNRLIVTKKYPVSRFQVEILDASTLGLIYLIDGISGDCQGVTVYNNLVYVAIDSGYSGINGRMAILNANTWQLDTILNFGPTAVGTSSVYSFGGYIYTINVTPYGVSNVGSITQYNPTNNYFETTVLPFKVGSGIGIGGSLLYLGLNNSIGSYDLNMQIIVDSAIIHYSGGNNNVSIHSAAFDYINNKFYTNIGNRNSFGLGVVFSLTGDSLTNYSTGINPDACAIDFRTPTGIRHGESGGDELAVYPNPATDYINIYSKYSKKQLREVKIMDITGRTMESKPIQEGDNDIRINILDYPVGIYLISFPTEQGIKFGKFIKRKQI
jgi:hypothetical protein